MDSCRWPRFKFRPGRTLKTCNFDALEVTAIYFTFLETSNLFYLDKRGQECSYMLIYDMLSGITIGLLNKMANECKHSHAIVCVDMGGDILSH